MKNGRQITRVGTAGPAFRANATRFSHRGRAAFGSAQALSSVERGRASLPSGHRGFTLAEVLAALLFMAILIPVAMHGVSVASRAGMLSQRKAVAMRIAERVLDEQIVTGLVGTTLPYGTIVEGDISYPWTLRTEPWTEDTMTVATVTVSFDVQGTTFDVAASTLYDPTAVSTSDTSSTGTATTP